jgi:hypothetical protein
VTPQAKEHEPPAAATAGDGDVTLAGFFGEGEAFTEECFVQSGEDG